MREAWLRGLSTGASPSNTRRARRSSGLGALPVSARADKAVVLAAVNFCGLDVSYASDALRADADVAVAAVTQDGQALKHLALRLLTDQAVVLAAVKRCGEALEFVAEHLQADPDIVSTAVRAHGRALAFAAPRLQAERVIVLLAVRQNGFALEFASEMLRADREVLLAATAQAGGALQFAAHEMRDDYEIASAAVEQCGRALAFASDELRTDSELVRLAVMKDPRALDFSLLGGEDQLLCRKLCDQLLASTARFREDGAALRRWDDALARRHASEFSFSELRHLVHSGVPPGQRLWLWPWLLESESEDASARFGAPRSDVAEQIELDLPRTQPSWMGPSETAALRNVLHGYAVRNPAVGYCQGMNFIAGVFVIAGFDEATAYRCFALLMDRFCPMYHVPGFEGYLKDAAVVQLLAHELLPSELLDSLDSLGVPLDMLAMDHFLSMAARVWPPAAVVRLWDLILFEGPAALFASFLALLSLYLPVAEPRLRGQAHWSGGVEDLDPVERFRNAARRGVHEDARAVLEETRRLLQFVPAERIDALRAHVALPKLQDWIS